MIRFFVRIVIGALENELPRELTDKPYQLYFRYQGRMQLTDSSFNHMMDGLDDA